MIGSKVFLHMDDYHESKDGKGSQIRIEPGLILY